MASVLLRALPSKGNKGACSPPNGVAGSSQGRAGRLEEPGAGGRGGRAWCGGHLPSRGSTQRSAAQHSAAQRATAPETPPPLPPPAWRAGGRPGAGWRAAGGAGAGGAAGRRRPVCGAAGVPCAHAAVLCAAAGGPPLLCAGHHRHQASGGRGRGVWAPEPRWEGAGRGCAALTFRGLKGSGAGLRMAGTAGRWGAGRGGREQKGGCTRLWCSDPGRGGGGSLDWLQALGPRRPDSSRHPTGVAPHLPHMRWSLMPSLRRSHPRRKLLAVLAKDSELRSAGRSLEPATPETQSGEAPVAEAAAAAAAEEGAAGILSGAAAEGGAAGAGAASEQPAAGASPPRQDAAANSRPSPFDVTA